MYHYILSAPFLNRRRIRMAQSAIFSSRFVTDNHLIRHTKCAVLNVHRFNSHRKHNGLIESIFQWLHNFRGILPWKPK